MPKIRKVKSASALPRHVIGQVPRKQAATTAQSGPETMVAQLQTLYQKNADVSKATAMKKYMRGQFEYFGLQSPLRRQLDKEVTKSFAAPSLKFVQEALELLWSKEQREFQMFAIDYAKKYKDKLAGEDSDTCRSSVELLYQLLTTKSWWDTIDMLASSVVGHMALKHPDVLHPTLDEWIDHDIMWLRRTAILHQLSYKQRTDADKLFRYCKSRSHEEEFFIQKAIGWALREYFKTDPESVQDFVQTNSKLLSNLSKREALKHA